MIALDWSTFQATDPWGTDEVLRAHEVAHQWWGIQVAPRTYRDRWLSEGLSEFSGLWYMQVKRRDTKLYLRTLEEMRERIMNAPFLPSTWLGYRTTQRGIYQGGYVSAIYLKGAWVFHMLRYMLLDLESMDEGRFISLMRAYTERYKGQRSSTADFRRLTEEHLGEPMDWFMKQWVMGTAIPTYRYWFRTNRTDTGQYRVTLHVEQYGVPEGFKMPVPVRIELPNGQVARTRVWVDKPTIDVDFPLLSASPSKLEFNEFSAVLCRLETPDR
jgi:aminopeptidase N